MARRTPLSALLALSLLAPTFAQQGGDRPTITWGPCDQDRVAECGTLVVPLDYTNENSPPLTLSLSRFPAAQQPAPRGSVLYNPGGPGEPGVPALFGSGGSDLSRLVGGEYDIVSWDPRGTGDTLNFNCSRSRVQGLAQVPSLGNNLTDFLVYGGWDFDVDFASACFSANMDTGELLSTAFGARDMISILNALGQDKLNYIGYSYGTVLGTTFSAMFPDRVGSVLLDGVVNPYDYVEGQDLTTLANTDAGYDLFLASCASNSTCALLGLVGNTTTTGPALRGAVDRVLAAYLEPAAGQAGRLKYIAVKGFIFTSLYSPGSWDTSAQNLYELLSSNEPITVETLDSVGGVFGDNYLGISCADTERRNQFPSQVEDLVAQHQTKGWFADFYFIQAGYYCTVWPFKAVEQFRGPFAGRTSSPILFVGSPYDPITPLEAAVNASSGFEGSVVLQHNGAGHTSGQSTSACTNRYVLEFFTNGTLPAEGTTCEPDERPFGYVPPPPGASSGNSGPGNSSGGSPSGGGSGAGNDGAGSSSAESLRAGGSIQTTLFIAAVVVICGLFI